jgi:dipeptidyl aminopeptidase/acylaminoacyl peptidase
MRLFAAVALATALVGAAASVLGGGRAAQGQESATTASTALGRRAGPALAERAGDRMEPERARQLYVSTDPADHARGWNFQKDIEAKAQIDARYAAAFDGVLDYRKVTYRSSVGDLDIPAYVFQPLALRGPRSHAAMIWVHGGVHGTWDLQYVPFVREAVARGYVIVAPDYRGSTGYGAAFHNAIDYGGHEIDDVLSAADFVRAQLPHVDPERLGIMGWSHGGYIALFTVFRDATPFKAAAAIVPVTNLVFRLSYKGPEYQRVFATQARIGGLPFEKRELYIARSPLYHVDKLRVPLLVHVATNDTDVEFVENQQIVDALRSRKAHLAETRVYVDPPPGASGEGHTFSRRTDPQTLERMDTPEQRDSWNRTWTFFDWWLRAGADTGRAPAPLLR